MCATRRCAKVTGPSHQARRLASGRLLDFFVLVRQILQTYNDGSAHVPLDDWEARSARIVTRGSRDEGSSCERCDETSAATALLVRGLRPLLCCGCTKNATTAQIVALPA